MPRIPVHTVDSAPEPSRDALKALDAKFGKVLNIHGGMANSPAVLLSYAAIGARLTTEAGGRVVDALGLLAPLGAAAYLDDGVHLTGAAYDLLLPALADALR